MKHAGFFVRAPDSRHLPGVLGRVDRDGIGWTYAGDFWAHGSSRRVRTVPIPVGIPRWCSRRDP